MPCVCYVIMYGKQETIGRPHTPISPFDLHLIKTSLGLKAQLYHQCRIAVPMKPRELWGVFLLLSWSWLASLVLMFLHLCFVLLSFHSFSLVRQCHFSNLNAQITINEIQTTKCKKKELLTNGIWQSPKPIRNMLKQNDQKIIVNSHLWILVAID